MPTYVSLVNFTDQGIKNIKETVDRARAARKLAEEMGGSLEHIYWTAGPYDLLLVSEFDDPENNNAWLLKLGSLGNIRTTTMDAFNEGEMLAIISKIPKTPVA